MNEEVERLATIIYNHWTFGTPPVGKKPAWAPHGNSLMQDRARNIAQNILDHGYTYLPLESAE